MDANKAIGRIRFMLDVGGSDGFTSADKEALNMAINALSAEITAPPKSNADRIRQLTDEELVEVLRCKCCDFINKPECASIDCKEGHMIWLKQEASEDAGTD